MGHPAVDPEIIRRVIAEFDAGGDNRDVDIARRLNIPYSQVSYITTAHTLKMQMCMFDKFNKRNNK